MFIEKPISSKKISSRKPVYGMGINDANYATYPKFNGKVFPCPFYTRWKSMIVRCYDPKYHETRPTYKDCAVCDEWLTFSNFKSWMKTQNWEGMHLDKDIINPLSKMYSPDNCAFITQDLNSLLSNHKADRGDYPQGVHWDKHIKHYRARVSVNGKLKCCGLYSSPEQASKAYIKAKTSLIVKFAESHDDERISKGLLKCAEILRNNPS